MTKAILRIDSQGVAQAPPILCAESAEEAHLKCIPLFTAAFAQVTAGLEISPNGEGYDLFEEGRLIGSLEIFTPVL